MLKHGKHHLQQSEYRQSLKDLKQSLGIKPDDAFVLSTRGNFYYIKSTNSMHNNYVREEIKELFFICSSQCDANKLTNFCNTLTSL